MRSNKIMGLILGGMMAVTGGTAMAQGIVVQVRPPHDVVERRIPAPGRGSP